ncbi:hypothetical protein DM01DRAFT_1337976 [Hesseltinella vesiculosa]|uniref:Cytochrome c oxidase assembly factor 3 n=1 Tax=Hesseltinella vesiculosa TaxID=101127 RepID=A0A1X2GBG8_9FUNG|nr:hypothetical protein DM01DRAFT_1337976 [Hesseltinella vesiculosa]
MVRDRPYSQPKGYGFTPALQRTRKPFAMRNMLTLGGLLAFTCSVYAYSMFAVKQDDFSDVPLPSQLPGVQDITVQERKKAQEQQQAQQK